MPTMRAMQVSKAGGDFELVEREVPQPGFGEVVVRVHACGICHSDMFAKEGGFPGVTHPLVPGHEIAGTIESLGEGVQGWEVENATCRKAFRTMQEPEACHGWTRPEWANLADHGLLASTRSPAPEPQTR